MGKLFKKTALIGILLWGCGQNIAAQDVSFQQNVNQGIIQIAEMGQLADTLNLWGDVRSTGKYLVPRGTNLTDLISYARGPAGLNARGTWTRVNLEIFVQRYNNQTDQFRSQSFSLRLNEPLPQEMKTYPLRNGDVITVKAKTKPTFGDYVSLIAPVLSLGLTTYLFFERVGR